MTNTTTTTAAVTTKAPTVAMMRARIAKLSQDMDYPVEYAASYINVKYTSTSKKDVVAAVLDKMEKSLIQRTLHITSIEALGGTATIKQTNRELIMLRSELQVLKEEADEANAPVELSKMEEQKKEIKRMASELSLNIKEEALKAHVTWNKAIKEEDVELVYYRIGNIYDDREATIEEIQVLGGQAYPIYTPTKDLHKAYNALVVAGRKEVAQILEEKEEVIETTPIQEAAPMTNGVTQDQLEKTMTMMMASITNVFQDTVSKQTERMDESARYVMALEKRIEQLTTPVATPAPVAVEQVVESTIEPDMDAIVYSEDQIHVLEESKKEGMDKYETMKKVFDNMNRSMGRTVGGVLNKTALFFDDKGHKGVDSVASIIDQTIESARVVATAVVNLSATTLTSANAIGRTAGHVIINGAVHTLELASNIADKK